MREHTKIKEGIMDIEKNLFQYVVEDYDYSRPGYPLELYETIRHFSGINCDSRILEVGAGTGQATELFAAHGHKLDLLEIGDDQVALLRKKYLDRGNIEVYKGYFEDFERDEQYDLIYSATAFHWIKCENGYPKAWNMLQKGGTMAVFWNMFWSLEHKGGIFDGLNDIIEKYHAALQTDSLEAIKEKRFSQITVGGYFDYPDYSEFRWIERYDAKRYTALMNTHPRILMLSDIDRMNCLREIKNYVVTHGGIVEIPELVCLYLVKK